MVPPARDDPLQPLRAMADRVGKEVEKFAERVDHWHTHGNEDIQAKYQSTVRLVGKFKDVAESTVKELKKQSEVDNQGEFEKSVRRRIQNMADVPRPSIESDHGASFRPLFQSGASTSSPAPSSVSELRQWQAELATWDLLRILIDHYHPEPGTDVAAQKRARLAQVGGAWRYCPNVEIWNRFLLEDDHAKEKDIILRWLEQSARNGESDTDTIIGQLEEQSGKSTSIWTNGWLDTKLQIKQAKMFERTDQPLRLDAPLKSSSDRAQLLVTRLDPDAPIRQKRGLEKPDDYYERALWMVCYEMVRRGTPWKDIGEWCKARGETWRGVSLGAAYASHPHVDSNIPNVEGPTVGFLFRRMCFYAARGARVPYETALYGLLSGDLSSVEPVCRTWDDHLYARYNALLLSRFDEYLQKNHAHRVSEKITQKFVPLNATTDYASWEKSSLKVIQDLKSQKKTAPQALLPIKLIQGGLISRNLDELFFKVGLAVGTMLGKDNQLGSGGTPAVDTTVEEYYQTLAKDPQGLRILVHTWIIIRNGLGTWKAAKPEQVKVMDNIIETYIEFLRTSKRVLLIPLYASQLNGKRQLYNIGKILPELQNSPEQKRCISLMDQYRIDAVGAISWGYRLALESSGLENDANWILKYSLLEPALNEKNFSYLWPDERVKCELAGMGVTSQEQALIASLQWYNHLSKDIHWTFTNLSDALKYLLLNGRFGAAEKLIDELSVESISQSRTEALCGYAFDFMVAGTEQQDEIQATSRASMRPSDIPSAAKHREHVKHLRHAALTYYNLQQLVRLITLFREWHEEEDKLIKNKSASDAKLSLKHAKELYSAIQTTFRSIVTPGFLAQSTWGEAFITELVTKTQKPRPVNPALMREHNDFHHLKKAYIPDVLLAYLAVVQAASFFMNRDSATEAMEVANLVADDDNAWIQKVLLETNRMTDLVDMLAKLSQAMLILGAGEDKKKVGSRKRGSRGESLRIWDLGVGSRS